MARLSTGGTPLAKTLNVMNGTEIILCLVALALVVLDVIVRLGTWRHSKDKWLEELLDSLVEPETATEVSIPHRPEPESVGRLGEHLFRHFQQSAVSRNVLAVLAARKGRMRENEVLAAVNRQLQARGRRELPAAVVRKVVTILMGADLVALRKGALEITSAGSELNVLLQPRAAAVPPAPVFVSR